jgi:hypothetical protein
MAVLHRLIEAETRPDPRAILPVIVVGDWLPQDFVADPLSPFWKHVEFADVMLFTSSQVTNGVPNGFLASIAY